MINTYMNGSRKRGDGALLLICAALATAAVVLLSNHVDGLNGPWYWRWPWRELAWSRVLGWLAPGGLLVVAAVALYRDTRLQTVLSLLLLMLGMFLLQLAGFGVQSNPFSLEPVSSIVEHPMHTSYFADAIPLGMGTEITLFDLLSGYPDFMPQFYMHAQNKPPGAVLFFALFIRLMGVSHATSLVCGLVIGALATLSVPATFWMVRTITANTVAGMLGAAVVAMSPGLVLHFPMMDQLYPAITCVIVTCWYVACRDRSARWAALCGLSLAAGCFVVYHFLTLGVILLLSLVLQLRTDRSTLGRRLPALLGAAIGSAVAFYVLVLLFTGFNPVNTFLQALVEQKKHLADLARPYPATVFWDLYDFALGFGLIAVVPIVAMLWRSGGADRQWGMICVAQPLVVAAIGVMQCETARTWCFMLPLIALPTGVGLEHWRPAMRVCYFVLMLAMMCVVCRNMTFMF